MQQEDIGTNFKVLHWNYSEVTEKNLTGWDKQRFEDREEKAQIKFKNQ
jgi:hypothetical protein